MATAYERIKRILVDHLGVEESEVTLHASIIDDLGADSLDLVELTMAFEVEFGAEITDEEAESWLIVQDVVRAAELLSR